MYDILAILWEDPRPAAEIRRSLEMRRGMSVGPEAIGLALSLLERRGLISTRDTGGDPVFVLAERGSRTLAEW